MISGLHDNDTVVGQTYSQCRVLAFLAGRPRGKAVCASGLALHAPTVDHPIAANGCPPSLHILESGPDGADTMLYRRSGTVIRLSTHCMTQLDFLSFWRVTLSVFVSPQAHCPPRFNWYVSAFRLFVCCLGVACAYCPPLVYYRSGTSLTWSCTNSSH